MGLQEGLTSGLSRIGMHAHYSRTLFVQIMFHLSPQLGHQLGNEWLHSHDKEQVQSVWNSH